MSAVYYITNTRLAVNDAVSNSRKEGAGQLEVDGVRMDKHLLLQNTPRSAAFEVRFSTLDHRNSLSHPQECPREGDDAFGEEVAGVAGAGFIERLVVHSPDKETPGKKLTAIRLVPSKNELARSCKNNYLQVCTFFARSCKDCARIMQEKGHIACTCQASLACKILAQSCMILQVLGSSLAVIIRKYVQWICNSLMCVGISVYHHLTKVSKQVKALKF